MAQYSYVGRTSDGKQVKGELEGVNAGSIAEQLSRRQIVPIQIIELGSNAKSPGSVNLTDLLGPRVSLDDLIVFCRQMYALMRSGVPILRAINGLSESSSAQALQSALVDIGLQLEGGRTLSTSMNKHQKVFTPLFISIIHVGENTGQLDEAFHKLSVYFERELETRKRIKTALRYPSFVMIAISIAMVILNIFVIPTFTNLFARLGSDLPWATKMLIGSSNFFVSYWPHLLIGLLFIIGATRYYLNTQAGAYRWDRMKLRLPIVGSIIERSILSRFSHSFAIVLRSGVPMTTGLSLVSDAVDNSYLQQKILNMRVGIESGDSLLRTAGASKMFTPLVLQMVAVGEETGRIDDLLEEVAEYYEREVDYELSTLTARIEPILIGIVAVMVLILALGIFTPMWDMMSAYKGS